MKYQILFSLINNEKVFINVVSAVTVVIEALRVNSNMVKFCIQFFFFVMSKALYRQAIL